jgi:hypothetical protein
MEHRSEIVQRAEGARDDEQPAPVSQLRNECA